MNRAVYKISRATARAYFKLYHRWRVIGLDHVPETGPVLLVANHASYFDPPLIAIANRRYVYSLARSTLGKFPPFRWLLHALATRFIDREGSARQGIDVAVDILKSGDALTIFPEGTRTHTGEVGAFKRGMLLILSRTDAPVVPVGVRGTWRALPRGAAFPRPARIEIEFGAPMSAAEVLAPGGLEEVRRRVVALAGGEGGSAGQESGNPGDGTAAATAEYRVPRIDAEGVGPTRPELAVAPLRPSGARYPHFIPRSSFDSFPNPRFV